MLKIRHRAIANNRVSAVFIQSVMITECHSHMYAGPDSSMHRDKFANKDARLAGTLHSMQSHDKLFVFKTCRSGIHASPTQNV